jgi:ankyrin repeat protein
MWGAGQAACAPSRRVTAAHRTAMASDTLHWVREAAWRNDARELERLLAAGADVHAEGGLALQWAAEKGHEAAVDTLVRAGANPNGCNPFGDSPLMLAATNNHGAVACMLIAAGADVNAAEEEGSTALHWACMCCHVDIIRVLLDAGARTDVLTRGGKSPFDVVCAHCRPTRVASLKPATRRATRCHVRRLARREFQWTPAWHFCWQQRSRGPAADPPASPATRRCGRTRSEG